MELQERFKSKRLKKKQLLDIWEKKNEKYFPLGYHWELYRLIKDNPGITVKEICERMPEYYHIKESESNYTNCPAVYEDIDYLMNSARIEKIIIKHEGTFRLGTKDENIAYANKLYVRGTRLMAKYGAISRRIPKDDQGKLLGSSLKPIDEDSQARPFIETHIRDAEECEDNNLH